MLPIEIMTLVLLLQPDYGKIGEDFIDLKLPTLDVKIWVACGIIEYDFFDKPMATNTVLHAKTAQSESTKFASLAQEVVRRLLHTSRSLPHSHGLTNLNRFSQKMANSGHKLYYTKKVMVSGIMKYKKKLQKSLLPTEDNESKPLHLGTSYNSLWRWKEKTLNNDNWYKDREGNEDRTAMARKPGITFQKDGKCSHSCYTHQRRQTSQDAERKGRELARITQFRIRYQEAEGTKLALMFSTDLGVGESCGRGNCQPCGSREERRPNCRAQSIPYESKCEVCNPKPTSSHQEDLSQQKPASRKGIYIGETSCTLYERSKEHLKDAADFDPSSHMVKH